MDCANAQTASEARVTNDASFIGSRWEGRCSGRGRRGRQLEETLATRSPLYTALNKRETRASRGDWDPVDTSELGGTIVNTLMTRVFW